MRAFAVLCCLILAGAATAYPAANPDIDKKIKDHRRDLERLQEQIKGLEQERKKLREDETILSTTLKRIELDIEQSKKKQSKMKRKVTESEARIKKLNSQVNLLTGEKAKWEQLVLADLNAYYVRSVYPQRLSGSHMQKLLTNAILSQKFQALKNVETSKKVAKEKELRLIKSKESLVVLKIQLDSEIQKQKKSQTEKSELFKTTSGRRIAAEHEAAKLRETAQSLESMIGKLRKRKDRERQKSLAAQKEAEQERKDLEERRGTLPWPVLGTVTSSFGKHKHSELNISVINDGIKIRTQSGAAVKSVEKGTVIFADDFRSYGPTVIVDHGGDLYTIYGLLGNIMAKEGQRVELGAILGNAGSETDPQVLFQVRSEGHFENPLSWLK